ncbi:MAG: hypothetical protein NTW72_04095, partial [Gemmatimonadetes bacterium]|nr:hypothetical protein [Gemmatimonadota bacterium]
IPLVARITDQYGNKVTGASVSWAVASGGGTLSPTTTVSDTGGRVRAQWTLGATVGTQSVIVSSTGLTGSPLTFTATATAVASSYASVGVGGSWDNPAAWSPAGIPGTLDDVTIGLSTSIVLTATAAVHTLNITGGTLDLGINELKVGGNVAAASATINGTGKLSMTGGGARTLSLAQVSNLYVDTSTVVSLGSNVTVTGNVAGTGNVSVAGQLWPNGHTLTVSNTNALSYGSQLSILPTGNLKMTLPADSVLAFNADFGGVASDTSLTAGFLRLDNSFSQSGDAKSFAPTGTHVTSLKATAFNNALRAITETAVPTRTRRSMAFNLLQFANPGYTASHFNILRLDHNNFAVDLGSNVYAHRVVTGDTLRTRTVSGSGSTLFMKDGSLVNLSFSGALLQVDSAVTTTQLDSVSFYAQAVTADQITINLTSGATPTLTNLSFGAAPTTGRYLVVNGAGTATMGNPNPGAHGGFVGTTGGAAISGWIASRNMTAATSGDWSTPAT